VKFSRRLPGPWMRFRSPPSSPPPSFLDVPPTHLLVEVLRRPLEFTRDALVGVVIAKRRATSDPGKCWVHMNVDDLLALLTRGGMDTARSSHHDHHPG
jgi:hypothetical protein